METCEAAGWSVASDHSLGIERIRIVLIEIIALRPATGVLRGAEISHTYAGDALDSASGMAPGRGQHYYIAN